MATAGKSGQLASVQSDTTRNLKYQLLQLKTDDALGPTAAVQNNTAATVNRVYFARFKLFLLKSLSFNPV